MFKREILVREFLKAQNFYILQSFQIYKNCSKLWTKIYVKLG